MTPRDETEQRAGSCGGGFSTALESFWGRFGVILVSFSPLGRPWGALGLLGVSFGRLGAASGRLGASLGRLWGVFGASWGVFGASVSVKSAVLGAPGRPPGPPGELPLGACRARMKAHFSCWRCPGVPLGGP